MQKFFGQALHSRLFSPFIVLKPAYLFGWEKLFYTTICMTPKALCIFWNCCFCIEIRNAIEEPLSANISGGKTCRFFMTYHGMQYFLQTAVHQGINQKKRGHGYMKFRLRPSTKPINKICSNKHGHKITSLSWKRHLRDLIELVTTRSGIK
ncbi:uncharacterized protein LOC115998361 [Ipomoea triloba]|uniref:uncharacterized protein LOC115998361 n=1 Tax=Ipomoea triloba TaxID=35885 RepID=UPI00125DE228|nr:uncharacterized protein LOC115998361 [Ipomoea triloba]XP_031093791.1 uncharacterized protein LOC115998361 [Ipomoea triloba]